jgi:putative flippase GtrA
MHLPQAVHRFNAPVVRHFVKYGIVGASNTLLTFVIYYILVRKLGVDYLVALVIGYFVGSLNSYILNRHWTFRAGHVAHATAGTRFAVVQISAILANLGLLYLFVHDLHIEKVAAQAILTIPVLAVTFFINRTWSFSHDARPGRPPSVGR